MSEAGRERCQWRKEVGKGINRVVKGTKEMTTTEAERAARESRRESDRAEEQISNVTT